MHPASEIWFFDDIDTRHITVEIGRAYHPHPGDDQKNKADPFIPTLIDSSVKTKAKCNQQHSGQG